MQIELGRPGGEQHKISKSKEKVHRLNIQAKYALVPDLLPDPQDNHTPKRKTKKKDNIETAMRQQIDLDNNDLINNESINNTEP